MCYSKIRTDRNDGYKGVCIMKILITTDWYEPVVNGVVTSVLNLTKQLKEKGHEVKILTLSKTRHTYIEGDVIYVGSVGVGLIYPEARLKVAVIRQIIKGLIDWKPDIIHSQCEFSTFFMAKRIAEELQIPIVHTYHTVYEDYTHYFSPRVAWGKAIVQKMTRLLSEKVDYMIAPSKKIADVLERYEVVCPVAVVPSGIDKEKYTRYIGTEWREKIRAKYGISDDTTVLLYVGRLAKEKNIEELLHYQKRAAKYNTKLLIVGGGPYKETLVEETKNLGIEDMVIFTGMIAPDQVAKYYQAGDLFVSASTSETQGLTYVEALAAGIPLLCREDPCLDQVVQEDTNGWTYTDEISFETSLSTWQQMLPDEKEWMRREAESSSEAFSSKTFGDKIEKIYIEECQKPQICDTL